MIEVIGERWPGGRMVGMNGWRLGRWVDGWVNRSEHIFTERKLGGKLGGKGCSLVL